MKPENLALLEKARVVYCTGFFITVSPDSIRTVAKHCADNDKIYAMVRAQHGAGRQGPYYCCCSVYHQEGYHGTNAGPGRSHAAPFRTKELLACGETSHSLN